MVAPAASNNAARDAGKKGGNDSPQQGSPIVSWIPSVPATMDHRPPEGLEDRLPNPGRPRANVTCDAEHPQGTYSAPDMTVMQQHVAFWDRDNDGVIWPYDTYVGFRRLGFNFLLSALAVLVIHGTFSYWSGDSWLPDPRFRIQMKNIHRCKHGSDSETYDTEGRFVPQKFEEVFSKFDRGNKGGLSLKELNEMVRWNRNIMDPNGWVAGWLEWNTTFYLAARDTPKGRLLMKDDARGAIDGTLFYRIARAVEEGKLRMRETQAGMERIKPGAAREAARKEK